jgi:hypothetical protein
MYGVAARLHQSYHHHPLLSVVLLFCSVYLMFKGVDQFHIFECLVDVFWFLFSCIFEGVSCFHS